MSSKRKNEDRLSHLPDEVLSHIISLMPTELAVRTSILSKRWRNTWTLITNLDFSDHHPGYRLIHCFSKYVDMVLERIKASQIRSFRLGLFDTSVQKSNVSKWISEAIRLNVCELDIHVSPTGLPLSLFSCKTLTKLRLVLSFINSDVFNVSSPIMLPNLKTLDLNVSSEHSISVFKFIHGCPMLENLSLEIAAEKYYNFNIPTLKRLKLKTNYSLIKVVLNVPNLEYLLVDGYLCPHFVMEDLSSLIKATVSFSHSSRDDHQKAALLKGLSGVKSLSWFTSDSLDFLHSPLPKFPNLKHLEWKNSYLATNWFLVIQILENSCELETLSFEEPLDYEWIEPQPIPTCMLSNLKTMKITKCKGDKYGIKFLEFMLGNAGVLKTLTIICEKMLMKEEMEMCARLLRFPRASKFCEIHFVGRWFNSIGN